MEERKTRSRAKRPKNCTHKACKHKAPPGFFSPEDIAVPCDNPKECIKYAEAVLEETIAHLKARAD